MTGSDNLHREHVLSEVWFCNFRRHFLKTLVAWVMLLPVLAAQTEAPLYEFFSGEVVELSADRLTVERKVRGKDHQRHTFLITPETKVEGKLSIKTRVTVGFKPGDEGDVAVRVIVRPRSIPSTKG